MGRTVVDEVQVSVLHPSAINPLTPSSEETTPEVTTTPTALTSTGDGSSGPPSGLDLDSTLIGAIGGFAIKGALFLLVQIIRRNKS